MFTTTKYEDLPNLSKLIRSHLVLLYNKSTYDTGSGVLVKIKERLFVLTAAHVLSDNLQINLGLPWHQSSLTILNKWINKKLDISFIELNPFEVEMFKIDELKPYEIGKRNVTTINPKQRNLAICGYPYEVKYNASNVTAFIPAFLSCAVIHLENWPKRLIELGKTSDKNIVIPFGPKHGGVFFDKDKKQLPSFDPHGLSGCGIWYDIPGDEFKENPRYALLGIQTSYFRQSQVLVGTFLEPLIDEIKKYYNIETDI